MIELRYLLVCVAVIFTTCAPAAAQQNDYGGYDIVGAVSDREHYYGETRQWRVYALKADGTFAYCVAEADRGDGSAFRLGWDGMQWQLAVPIEARPDWEGTLQIDGRGSGRGYGSGSDHISGTANGGWAIAWLGEAELDGLRQGSTAVLGVGKFDYDFSLSGSAAAILKVKECVDRSGQLASAAQASGAQGPSQRPGSGFGAFRGAPSCSSVLTSNPTPCTITPWDPEPGHPAVVQVDLPDYLFLVKVRDDGVADVWYAMPPSDEWTMIGEWASNNSGSGCIEPLANQNQLAMANLGQDYWQLCIE